MAPDPSIPGFLVFFAPIKAGANTNPLIADRKAHGLVSGVEATTRDVPQVHHSWCALSPQIPISAFSGALSL